jgi:hypothetical protein
MDLPYALDKKKVVQAMYHICSFRSSAQTSNYFLADNTFSFYHHFAYICTVQNVCFPLNIQIIRHAVHILLAFTPCQGQPAHGIP